MKRLISILLVFLSFSAYSINTYYYYTTFYDHESKPYIELYFAFVGNSLVYEKIDDVYKASIELSLVFKQNAEIKLFDKLYINAPQLRDSSKKQDFIYVHRMFINPGIYNVELIVRDTLNKTKSGENRFYDVVQVLPLENDLKFSGITYIEKSQPTEKENIFSKSGNDLYPYIFDFYPSTVNKFQAYVEIYNTLKVFHNEDFLVRYFINKVSSSQPFENYMVTKKVKPQQIIPFMMWFDISQLPSGNYYLTIEIVNKENKVLLTEKSFFQRSNPAIDKKYATVSGEDLVNSFVQKYNNLDSLKDLIRCIYPIANDIEWSRAMTVLSNKNTDEMKRFILEFWKSRNPLDPESEWLKYKVLVDYVNKLYSTQVKKGYDSDRGRVYLKYGAPNNIVESKHEPSAYPYEIWHYYVVGNQRDRRFVFYNPTLVGNDYILLHSDVRGEIYDKNWERRLSSRNNTLYNFDATESDEQYGGRAKENFKFK